MHRRQISVPRNLFIYPVNVNFSYSPSIWYYGENVIVTYREELSLLTEEKWWKRLQKYTKLQL